MSGRTVLLETQYAEAAADWLESGDAALWDACLADGLIDAAPDEL